MLDLFLALTSPPAVVASSCGAPAITNAGIQSTSTSGDVRFTRVAITVVNHGPAQAPSILQSVDVYQNGSKVDQKGVPPLKAGASATVTYTFKRSAEAHDDTTRLRLQLAGHDAHGSCSTSGSPVRITV
jgi:subtilase family serine protease